MKNDIVERLRATVFPNPAEDQRLREVAREAASEIEGLRFDLGNMAIQCRHLLQCLDLDREMSREERIFVDEIRSGLSQKCIQISDKG